MKDAPERESRNLATGQTIKVAAAKKLNFAPAKALKDALNNDRGSGIAGASP